jgi:hypothetical protein
MTRRLPVAVGAALWLVAATAGVARADNCGTIIDCFPSGRSVLLALAAVLVVAGLVALTAGGGALLAGLFGGLFGGGSLALASGGVAASAGAVSLSATAAGQLALGGAAAITSGVLLAATAEGAPGGGQPSGRARYEPSPKHGPAQRGDVAAAPRDGQAALDRSVQVKPTSARRVGVDAANQELVVFDETYPGQQIFHGHVRSWNQLRPEMQAALRRAGLVDARGRIIAP